MLTYTLLNRREKGNSYRKLFNNKNKNKNNYYI